MTSFDERIPATMESIEKLRKLYGYSVHGDTSTGECDLEFPDALTALRFRHSMSDMWTGITLRAGDVISDPDASCVLTVPLDRRFSIPERARRTWPSEQELKPWETLAPLADRLVESISPVETPHKRGPEMSDEEAVFANVRAAMAEGREIDDATARVIGSMYHEGQASDSYSFASTGRIADRTDLYRECFPDYNALSPDDRLIADMFGTYLANRPDMGPVPGWSRLWVS